MWAGIIVALAAIGVVGFKLIKTKSGVNNLGIDLSGRIHSIDFSKVVFAINAIVKNPSDVKAYIIQPYVSILHQDKEIATSDVSDKIISIAPFEPAPLKTIYINASFFNLASLAGEFSKKIQNKNLKITLQVKIIVNVIVGLKAPIPNNLRDYKGSKTIIPTIITKDITF